MVVQKDVYCIKEYKPFKIGQKYNIFEDTLSNQSYYQRDDGKVVLIKRDYFTDKDNWREMMIDDILKI